jgi:dipeptidyl aminopeptidase/acylaminoacyl peptidase
MTRLGNPSYAAGASSKGIVAKFSPDGKHFAVVLMKGNLDHNTNDYSLILFDTSTVFQSPGSRVLLSMSSSSNRPAIENVVWLDDNDTILFLGEYPGEQTQLYSIRCSSKEMKKLTNHATSLTSFVATANGDEVVYASESPVSTFFTGSSRTGIIAQHQVVSDLIKGEKESNDYTLFVKRTGNEAENRIEIQGRIENSELEMSLSPDGVHLLVQTEARAIPPAWGEYQEKFLQTFTHQNASPDTETNVHQYEVADMRTGASHVLVDAPIQVFGSEMAWSPDGKSVVVAGIYLPLNVDDPAERALRRANSFLAEFNIANDDFISISHDDLRLLQWDRGTNAVICDVGRLDSLDGKATPKAYFRKSGETWSRVTSVEQIAHTLPDIVLEEDVNTAPRMFAIDSSTGRRSLLMDLNPQFESLAFAKVEEVNWKNSFGGKIKAGLYWPAGYVPGRKYPLIIQTHGWDPDRFWMDGLFTTAFAARSFAGKGYFVLQASDLDWRIFDTAKEIPYAMATYESAIDYLDRRGLIDRNLVGIIGFSRTCVYVGYTITHSKHHFGAAAVADGPYGFFAYLAFVNASPSAAAEVERQSGGPPFGKGLRQWLKTSPEFAMDKVETPLRVQAIGPSSLIGEWPWLTGLSRLNKPVELLYIPEGTHILEKPWDRMVSQQGDVDWFSFWLKDQEDPDPAKAEQYKRWRELRRLTTKTSALIRAQ